MPLAIDVEHHGAVSVLAVRGEIDLGSAPRLHDAALAELMGGQRRLVLDLTGVEFIDSIGLGTLVAVLKRARSLGGDLVLVIANDRVRAPFEVTGLTAAIAIHPTAAAATAGLQAAGS